jgi:putative acetyltransferase
VSTITVEDPRQPEVEAMVRAGDAYALSLYPADSCYLLSLDELAEPGVTVFIARAWGIRLLQLETGPKQHAAIALYERRGDAVIERFGPYMADEYSLCMEMRLA